MIRKEETIDQAENRGCQDPIIYGNTYNELQSGTQTAGDVEGENDERK